MNKFAAITVAASMFAVAACKEAPADPTPPVIDEPDTPKVNPSDKCNDKGVNTTGERCK